MDQGLLQFGLTAFVTIFVVTDPIGVAPIFLGLTRGLHAVERSATLSRALVIAFSVTLFFLLAGCFRISASQCTPSR
jgi:multiple antibiotic resistance protein